MSATANATLPEPKAATATATSSTKPKHRTASREEWLAERKELLKAEKELTRRSDELAKRRTALPWVRVEKDYTFDTEAGKVTLADLFQGRSQLIVYHFMFGPDYEAGCPSCSSIADTFDGMGVHLANHDVMLRVVSRAPLPKLLEYRKRMGWKFPWASSFGSDFNFDFNVSFTAEQQMNGDVEYNFRKPEPDQAAAESRSPSQPPQEQPPSPIEGIAQSCGIDVPTYCRDLPGMSAFIKEGDAVYHTYSAYSRGLDGLWGMFQWLDRAPLGRNEPTFWIKRHDEYGASDAAPERCCCTPGTSSKEGGCA